MKKNHSPLLIAMAFAYTPTAFSHGWTEFPEARQSICYEQGGIWTGNIPNAACKAAYDESGSYPFVQRNEVAINIPDYTNQAVVRQMIPNGTLCYANDLQKKGLGVEHSAWTRTEISPGTFELIFNATAPHNPSYWEIFITKPGVDVAKPLAWDDLELLQEYGNIAIDAHSKYRMNVTIPADRSGDAVLFTRWQRIDAVGEGFYNCSDITITGSAQQPPVEQPPADTEGAYLHQGANFVPAGVTLESAQVGDEVKYEVFNKHGEIHNTFTLKITQDNQNDWDRLLASQVSGYYQSFHSGNVFIGAWHDAMDHYMYFRDNLQANYFNSKDDRASGLFSIVEAQDSDLEAIITPQILTELLSAQVEFGQLVVLHPNNTQGSFDSVTWEQLSGPLLSTEIGSQNELLIKTDSVDNTQHHQVTFKLLVSDSSGSDSAIYSFDILAAAADIPETPETPETPEISAWDATVVYYEGDKVTHNGKVWTAHWWTQGENDEPGTTGEWGVWR
ncbi:lytic polysaccharide monooxygenase [Vibrio gallicus]|uniref:lytic polysaccharide monooxygenase n=1 Tax=Vibrio gallicus TaxID=190897 RepID=UPI0021C3C197|nr:lytic polysaccharide monooxygenase [Vibrio gallicus]